MLVGLSSVLMWKNLFVKGVDAGNLAGAKLFDRGRSSVRGVPWRIRRVYMNPVGY